jgi:hypothetical protein
MSVRPTILHALVVDSVLNLFKTVDGFKERVKTGTKAEVVEIIGRYLQAISLGASRERGELFTSVQTH